MFPLQPPYIISDLVITILLLRLLYKFDFGSVFVITAIIHCAMTGQIARTFLLQHETLRLMILLRRILLLLDRRQRILMVSTIHLRVDPLFSFVVTPTVGITELIILNSRLDPGYLLLFDSTIGMEMGDTIVIIFVAGRLGNTNE